MKQHLDSYVQTYSNTLLFLKTRPERLVIHAEEFTPAQVREIVRWLKEHGAEYSDDSTSYAGQYENTFHAWIGTSVVNLCLGFQYKGQTPEHMRIALETFRE